MLLEGTFVFRCLIAWPAFKKTGASAQFERDHDRPLYVLAWVSVLVAVITGGFWLLIVASNMSGMPVGSVMQGGVVTIVLKQTHFGTAWLVRAALLAVMIVCLLLQPRTRSRVPGWIALVASSAFVAALAWAGHGAASEDVPFDAFHAPADILHLLASGAWLGGLVPLVILLAQAAREHQHEAVAVARAATIRFSVLGIACVGTLIVTGIVNTWFLAGSVPALLGTLYGQLLLVKVALFLLMIAAASGNQRRLVPLLAASGTQDADALTAIRHVWRNASIEAFVGIFVLACVAVIGILPPGAHTEPRWPFPFRIDFGEIPPAAQIIVQVTALAALLCSVLAAVVADKKRYRQMAVALAVLVVSAAAGFVALRPGIVQAYPTSFYASPQAYAAPSVAAGAPAYAQNCTACHGANGRGDGPLAAKLPIRPADLTEEHLFGHKVGEMYWWISHGKSGVMPGFADKLSDTQRWDLINFILARAAGDQMQSLGSHVGSASTAPLPDFAFEQNGSQNTLSQTLKSGPVLLVLCAPPHATARLAQLAGLQPRLSAGGLQIVAVDLESSHDHGPLMVQVSNDVRSTLELFRSRADGAETELLLDRGGNVRARWTLAGSGGLPGAPTLLADAAQVARTPVAAANHAGHGG